MKKKQNDLSRLKHGIFQEKAKGKKEVIRKINQEEAEYLQNFFIVEPYLYEIKMNFPKGFNPKGKNVPGIVKTLFFDYTKERRYTVFKRLNKNQLRDCRRCGLEPRVYKYKITLV